MVNLEFENSFDDDDYSDEFDEGDDWNDDDPSLTICCPMCDAEVYEDAEQCPACGSYIARDTAIRPVWKWTAAVLLALLSLLAWSCLTSALR